MARRTFSLCALAWVLAARAAAGQPADSSAVRVALVPERPVQGTVFTIAVRTRDQTLGAVDARFAGEPIRFQTLEDGGAWAVAAVPVDAGAELPLEVDVSFADGRIERVTVAVAVTRGRRPVRHHGQVRVPGG